MQRSEKHTARATTLILLSSCCFGSISVLTTLVSKGGMSLIPAMFWRYLVATAIAGVLVWWRERGDFKLSIPLLLVGGIGQAFVAYVSLRALDYIAVGPLAFLFYTYPAWVVVVSALRGIDRMTPVRGVALAAALIGVTIIVGSPFSSSLNGVGVTLALLSAVAYGIYIPAISSLQVNVKPMVAALHMIVGAAVAFGIAAILSAHVTGAAALGVITLAVLSTVVAFWMFLAGLAVLGPVRSAIIATVEPFFTVVLGSVVLSERLNIRTGSRRNADRSRCDSHPTSATAGAPRRAYLKWIQYAFSWRLI